MASTVSSRRTRIRRTRWRSEASRSTRPTKLPDMPVIGGSSREPDRGVADLFLGQPVRRRLLVLRRWPLGHGCRSRPVLGGAEAHLPGRRAGGLPDRPLLLPPGHGHGGPSSASSWDVIQLFPALRAGPTINIGDNTHKTYSYAGFGQVTLNPIEQLSLTGGLRVTHEKKTRVGSQTCACLERGQTAYGSGSTSGPVPRRTAHHRATVIRPGTMNAR